MNLSLIICTYQRPQAVCDLLDSISKQTLLPDEVIIVDGSNDHATMKALDKRQYHFPLSYFLVTEKDQGLTRQRNFGIAKVQPNAKIVAFLDDDLILEPDYFEKLLETYTLKPDAIGVGGIDLKENRWFLAKPDETYPSMQFYTLDGWVIEEPMRYRLRKMFGLMSNLPPGRIPEFSHGRSSFPPNRKIYEVEHFMGGISSYRREVFEQHKFSNYFEGYGLYEDFDFTVRISQSGKLYVNTAAQVWHYHAPSGRPNQFRYGKMVVRNGWYVWRLKHPSPLSIDRIKWHLITLLLAFIKLGNAITGPNRRQALSEFCGRFVAWINLFFSKPVIEKLKQ